MGNLQVVLRSYAWVMALGAEGLVASAETAVLNNNYLQKRFEDVRGLDIPYSQDARRLDEVRYTWQALKADTGIGTEDIERRIVDYGVNSYFSSHEPWVVPEPFTPEPAESYSQADLDEYAEIIKRVADEAYESPGVFAHAPYKAAIQFLDEGPMHDIEQVVTTWRLWQRLHPEG
jgi:glycine dehydrogenase subunit 2